MQKTWAQGEQLIEVYNRFLALEAAKPSANSRVFHASARSASSIGESTQKRAITAMRRALVVSKIVGIGLSGDGKQRAPLWIPPEFWIAAKIEPDAGRAWQPGRVFDEISIVSIERKLPIEDAEFHQIVPKRVAPPLGAFPEKAGATSFADERETVILTCFAKFEDFEKWSFPQRQKALRAEAASRFPDRDWSRGFGRTAIYDTIRKLRSAGRIPSDNVR